MLARSHAPLLRVAPGARRLHLDCPARGGAGEVSAVGGPGFGPCVSPSGVVMFASLLSRPVVQRVLSTSGPLVIYSALAWLSGSAAVTYGWSSPGVPFTVFFAGIVVQEVRWCLTGGSRLPPYRPRAGRD